MGRICIAGDQDPELISQVIGRWQNWTGKEASKRTGGYKYVCGYTISLLISWVNTQIKAFFDIYQLLSKEETAPFFSGYVRNFKGLKY